MTRGRRVVRNRSEKSEHWTVNPGPDAQTEANRFDVALRELGAIESNEEEANAFWRRLRPRIEEKAQARGRLWLPRLAWALTGAATVLVLAALPWGIWVRSLQRGSDRLANAGVFLPKEYDPSLDFIVFRGNRVLAYQPAAIDRDSRMFLETLDLFAARLQWLAVAGQQIQIGLNSSELQTKQSLVSDQSSARPGEMIYLQVSVFRTGSDPARPYVARILALPGSQVHLDAKSADGAEVSLSVWPQKAVGRTCSLQLDMRYAARQPGAEPAKLQKQLSLNTNEAACAGTFEIGSSFYTVYVSVRSVAFEMAQRPSRV